MTVGAFLLSATKLLNNAGIDSARLDGLLFLEDALSQDRAHILAHLETNLSKKTEVELNNKIVQRSLHIPLAYIRGHAMFYGRIFVISKTVLVPRPETESIIDLIKKLALSDHPRIADMGTGSGCLAITAALELPNALVDAYDIDKSALAIAKRNASQLHAKVRFHPSNLFESYKGPHELIMANLPYVPTSYPINQAARHEPPLALFGGQDGLDIYRTFWDDLAALPKKPNYVLTETLASQHVDNAELASKAGYQLSVADGLVQCFKLR